MYFPVPFHSSRRTIHTSLGTHKLLRQYIFQCHYTPQKMKGFYAPCGSQAITFSLILWPCPLYRRSWFVSFFLLCLLVSFSWFKDSWLGLLTDNFFHLLFKFLPGLYLVSMGNNTLLIFFYTNAVFCPIRIINLTISGYDSSFFLYYIFSLMTWLIESKTIKVFLNSPVWSIVW